MAVSPVAASDLDDAPFTCGTVDLLKEDPGARGVLPCFHTLANVVESEHFSVQWDTAGGTTESAAQFLLDNLEGTRLVFLDAGYAQPAGNPDYKVPFYLGNSGPNAPGINFSGGYTTTCASNQHAYVVLSGIEASNGTADVSNHELFHAVQMGSPEPWGVEGFYWESSATWAEELAAPELNIYQWFLPYYTSHTQWALDYQGGDTDGFLHPYAMFILPMYISESAPSGPEALLNVWNGSGGGIQERLENAWRATAVDTSFEEQFGIFTTHVSVMDFVDQATYNPYRVAPRAVVEPPETIEEGAPQWYGSHFFRVDPGADDIEAGRTKLRLTFSSEQTDWAIAINRSPDGNTANPTVVLADEDGSASVSVIDVGTLYEETWVIVSNTRRENEDYTLDIELVEQTEAPGSDLEPPGDDDGPNRPGAGCKGPSGHPFSFPGFGVAFVALLLLPLSIRRFR